MSEIHIEQASDRAFRADLNAHLDNEAFLERQAESIEQHARDLIQKGEEFYPWTFKHFEEAISNARSGERKVMFATIASAIDLHLDNHHANAVALVAVKQLVERYWLNSAILEARKS